MSEQDNVKVVKQAYEAFKRGDIQGVLNTMSDDIDFFTPGPSDVVPTAGRRHGREQVAKFFSTLESTEEIQQFEPQEYIAQGDKVVVTGKIRARIKPTGKTVESDWVHVHGFRGGKIASCKEFMDTAAAVEAYGRSVPTAGKARS
jgi:ketosteroid isomerase-like protein